VNWRKARHRAPPGGKLLLVGPGWNGQKPEGFGFAFSPFAASSSILCGDVCFWHLALMSAFDPKRRSVSPISSVALPTPNLHGA
jgi:hypothetical protein